MIRLKLDKIIADKNISMYKLHIMTGVRPNTVSDLVNNRAKQWSPELLDKVCKALEISDVNDLFEIIED